MTARVTTISGVALALAATVLLALALARPRESATDLRRRCGSNMRQIMLAARMYAQDADGRLPARDRWQDALYPYLGNRDIYRCLQGATYDWNVNLETLGPQFIGERAAMLPACFETWDRREFAFPHRPRPWPWAPVMAVGFVDGHMQWRSRSSMVYLDWPDAAPLPYGP